MTDAQRHLDRFMTLIDHPFHRYSAIAVREGDHAGETVGLLMVQPIPPSGGGEPSETEIGWRQRAQFCGHDYVSEAAREYVLLAKERGLESIVAVTDPKNVASQKVAQRIGLTRVGLSNDYYDKETLVFRG